MKMSSAAEEAILRAKAIAARLAATSSAVASSSADVYTDNNTVNSVLEAAFNSQSSDPTHGVGTSTSSGKRKRWGNDAPTNGEGTNIPNQS